MKLTTNLLPQKYICFRRDENFIVISCLVFIFVFWVSLKQYFNIKNKLIKLENRVDDQIIKLNTRKKKSKDKFMNLNFLIRKTVFPKKKKDNIKSKITYFNVSVCNRTFLWYDFFHQIEMILPDGIWIKSINVEKIPTVVLECEAAQSYYAPQFLRNLINNPYFTNAELGDSEIDPKTKRTTFTIKFKFKSDVTKDQYNQYLENEKLRQIKKRQSK